MIPRYLKHLISLTRLRSKELNLLLILIVLEVSARLAQPYLYKILVDNLSLGMDGVSMKASMNFMIILVGLWFLLSVINNILNAYSQYYGWQIGNHNSQIIHLEGYKKLLRLDYHKHTQVHSSKHAKIIDEADTSMWEMTNWWLNRFLPAGLGFIGMLIIALTVSVKMTLLSLVVIPPGLYLIITLIKRNEDEQYKVNKLWNQKHEHLSDQITNIVTYKLNQNEGLFLKVQKGYSDRASHAQMELNKKWRLVTMLNPDVIARFMVMGLGIFMVKSGEITLGTLFMFMGLLNEILVPLHVLGDILPQYSRRTNHIEKYLKLLDQVDIIEDPLRAEKLKTIRGKIEFKNVSFKYANNEKKGFGLNNVSFEIQTGQHIALVGHSGAGKSTIVNLLTRLSDPSSGEILVDGVNIKKIKQENYRSFIGTVLQENALYNETIAQNIAYGKPDATRAEIISASKKANAHDFIHKLPDGYDTQIGERGVRLSGGEKQRLAIARAILKNPKIVILDEPTSALDSITEARVQKALEKLMKGRTTVTIAHRLSTVKNADLILVIENGEIRAQGNHAELMKRSKDYQRMVSLQTKGFFTE